MTPLEEAFGIMGSVLRDLPSSKEELPVREAVGRVLAGDQRSCLDLPPFHKSAVDGYALMKGKAVDGYAVTGVVFAGESGAQPLLPGTAVKVMTGCVLPEGTDRVVMVEYVREEAGHIRLVKPLESGANICRQAEDVKRGDLLMREGARLRPLDVAVLLACGATRVQVKKPIRMVVLATGDEIVDDPEKIRPGKIINSNGPLLEALAREAHLEVLPGGIVPDERDRLRQVIQGALESAEMIVLSGGVSVGDKDFVPSTLKEMGLTIHFSKLAVKPGKPTLFASTPSRVAFGLPGNPVSAYLMFHLIIRHALLILEGATPRARRLFLPLENEFVRRHAERLEFVPARLTGKGALEAVPYNGSAHLCAVIPADGFFIVPLGQTRLLAGAQTEFFPVPGWSL